MGVIVGLIVLMGSVPWPAYVPGIFVGCYSTFAINADWKFLGASLIAGAVLGLLCDKGGELAVAVFGDPEPAENAAAEPAAV